MAASAGHAVAYTICPIFKHIIDCVQLYFANGFMNIVLKSINCLWLVGLALIFDDTPQIIVQRCKIAAPSWPNDISTATDNVVFKNRAQNIKSSAVLLKPNVANILLFNFCEQKFVQHDPITIAIDCNGLSCSFLKKNGPIMPLDQNPHQTVTRFEWVGFSMYACGFSVPQMRQFCLYTYPPRSKWASTEKIIFFCQIRHFQQIDRRPT